MPPELLYDLNTIASYPVIADQAAIQAINPQRFEMYQLSAIVHVDPAQHLVIGYKDVTTDEFWIRGHMPDYPLMPGVMMCEAAAQLTGYYAIKYRIVEAAFLVFAGMDDVRFRGQVRVGDRLVLVSKGVKVNRRQVTSNVQGFVGDTMVFHGNIIGMPFNPGK